MATGPFGIGFCPRQECNRTQSLERQSFVFSNALQVRDFLGGFRSAARNDIRQVNHHILRECEFPLQRQRRLFPTETSSVSSKVPDAPRVTVEGGSNKVCALRQAQARSKTAPRAKWTCLISDGLS